MSGRIETVFGFGGFFFGNIFTLFAAAIINVYLHIYVNHFFMTELVELRARWKEIKTSVD